MIGYQQFVKLAIGCLFITALLHVPGMIYAQEKSNLKLDLFDFPVAPNQMMSNEVNNIRESGAMPAVGIIPMSGHQTLSHVIVPYMLYNIYDEANITIRFDPGNGILTTHEQLIKDEMENNQVQIVAIQNTELQGDNLEIWIDACQNGTAHCTNVVIIVTVDGRPPKALAAPYGN